MSAGKPLKKWQETALNSKRPRKRAKRRIMAKIGDGTSSRTVFVKNLSETGAFVHTNGVSRPGTVLDLDILFPDRTVSLRARVVWAKKVPDQMAHLLDCGMGLQFVETPLDWDEFYKEWAVKAGVI